jgi:Resolvase, N terminal domain
VHETYGHVHTAGKEAAVGELLGYMRISTTSQRFDLQRDALLVAGVAERYLYQDTASGMKQARPGLLACLLARSLLYLMEVAAELDQQRIALRVLEGPFAAMDTSTSEGKLLFSLLGAFAEFERALIHERVVAGLAAARARPPSCRAPHEGSWAKTPSEDTPPSPLYRRTTPAITATVYTIAPKSNQLRTDLRYLAVRRPRCSFPWAARWTAQRVACSCWVSS